jgi:hypothetical protein
MKKNRASKDPEEEPPKKEKKAETSVNISSKSN